MMLPALRPIEAFPLAQEGQQCICLRDPEGIVSTPLLLTPSAFFIACHLDGKHNVTDIQYAYARQFGGQLLLSAEISRLVETLDNHGFLQTERFLARRRQIEAAFAQAETRPAYLAGTAYPEQPGQLRAFLDAMFEPAHGGQPPGAGGTGRSLRGLIVPHIDFQRGRHAYAQGYRPFFQHASPSTVFLFGVAHASPPVPFILTQKHFATPFGRLETDRRIVQRLASVCSWDPYAYEIVHRTEHSIELQTVILAYLYGPSVRIVPILCASFGSDVSPAGVAISEGVKAFLQACQELIATAALHVSVIAGADLAHVGRRFGDPFDIDETIISKVAARDREDLQYVIAGDADGFYQSVMKDRNQRRVCGLTCIYAALKALPRTSSAGQLLHYDYAYDPAGGIVSFADLLLP